MAGFDWSVVGGAITAMGIGIGGVYAWWQKTQRTAAVTRAEVAEAGADKAVADASSAVYTLLTNRLTRVEAEQTALRAELAGERRHIRRLTLHIWLLEGLMRQANLVPPPFVDDEVIATDAAAAAAAAANAGGAA
jgi:hypothetical protein